MDIDSAPTLDFIDSDGRPCQLRFAGTPTAGRAGMNVHDTADSLAGQRSWMRHIGNIANSPAIRQRFRDAGAG